MPRKPRSVLPGAVHHVTQRGVNRCSVFRTPDDREVYLHLVEATLQEAQVKALAYCLMTNHVHWVVRPATEDSLAVLFRRVHGRYAQYFNAKYRRIGHLWQNRFFSCFVQESKEDLVLRYTEHNPVRAGLARYPQSYEWSSASLHSLGPEAERRKILDWDYWKARGGAPAWQTYVLQPEDPRETDLVRRATYACAPLGSTDYVAAIQQEFGRTWVTRGRPLRKGMNREEGNPLASSSATMG